MNRTSPSSMCGIILPSGRDCTNAVNPDAPLNLCDNHFAKAFRWWKRSAPADPEFESRLTECDYCGRNTVHPGRQGWECLACGIRSSNFRGAIPLSDSDMAIARIAILAGQIPAHEQRTPAKVQVVYYVQFADRVKIGTTRDFRKRLESIPHDDVLALERGGFSLERNRHSQFRAHRLAGEWFSMSPELQAHIDTLRTPGVSYIDQLKGWNAW